MAARPQETTDVAMRPEKAPSPRQQLKAELERFAPSFEALLPKDYPVERLITGALLAATKNPDVFKCTPASVATALATIAQWQLDVGHTAHLVPFNVNVGTRDTPKWEKQCTAVADYKGLIELMCAAGARKVEAREVRKGDVFEYAFGSETFLKHVPQAASGAEIIAAWAVVTLKGGAQQIEVMTAEEIEAVRKSSKQWAKGVLPYWYARKAVIRRLAKYVPRTARLQKALELDEVPLGEFDEATGEIVHPERRALPKVSTAGYDADGGDTAPGPKTEVLDRPGPPKPTTMFQGEEDPYEVGDAREDDDA